MASVAVMLKNDASNTYGSLEEVAAFGSEEILPIAFIGMVECVCVVSVCCWGVGVLDPTVPVRSSLSQTCSVLTSPVLQKIPGF